eukprot:5663250-Lingulodinium_polyedra.AAC.1
MQFLVPPMALCSVVFGTGNDAIDVLLDHLAAGVAGQIQPERWVHDETIVGAADATDAPLEP